MAIEDQIPTLIAMVGTLIAIGWYAIRDSREGQKRIEKELCGIREVMNDSLTEMYDRIEKHEEKDDHNFHEIFGKLAEMRGRDEAHSRRQGAV